jgi:F420-dependent oxidoreductase-like protein
MSVTYAEVHQMQVGLLIPQGWKGEYDGWPAVDAWLRTTELARQAEDLGFESIWAFDHFHTVPEPTDEITFESWTTLAAFAALTHRVRMGHMVVCAGYRSPALVAKMSSTLDVISGGRFELGIGAGWKEDEWLAYGYGFPAIGERLDILGDALEVITRMFAPGRASYEGGNARVRAAINIPKGVQQPRIPIIVGGNGPQRTAGYAIRFADELNFVTFEPDEVAERIAAVRERCDAEGRDPATLRFSIYVPDPPMRRAGAERADLLRRYADAGLDRLIAFPTRWSPTADAQAAFAEDARAAGLTLAAGEPVSA